MESLAWASMNMLSWPYYNLQEAMHYGLWEGGNYPIRCLLSGSMGIDRQNIGQCGQIYVSLAQRRYLPFYLSPFKNIFRGENCSRRDLNVWKCILLVRDSSCATDLHWHANINGIHPTNMVNTICTVYYAECAVAYKFAPTSLTYAPFFLTISLYF